MSESPIGRGAGRNIPNRFERLDYDPENWDVVQPLDAESEPRKLKTVFYRDFSRTILTENNSPDVGFRVSINPYRGCEHGCAYCYARPTHEYLGLSAGLDFESKIFVKTDAPQLLRDALMKPSYQPETIAISGVTDCYQPAERHFTITRQCLEVLEEFKNPVGLITKNHLITRDLDLLKRFAAWNGAAVFISVTTLDPELCSVLEPRTSRPRFRLEAISQLADAGIPVGVMLAPIIPGLTDHEIPSLLAATRQAGARYAGIVPLRLPGAVLPIFTDWLATHRPDAKDKVLNRIRSVRGGKLNDANFGSRMKGEGIYAEQIHQIFDLYHRKEGFEDSGPDLSVAHFHRPGDQLKLF